MSGTVTQASRKERFLNRWHAARATRARAQVAGFAFDPEPRSIGNPARGAQLLAGDFLFAGHLLQQPGTSDLWSLEAPTPAYEREMQGFGWLDDLAAIGTAAARAAAHRWLQAWILQYGRGRGAGWTADLAGHRLLRWINHGPFILRDARDTHRDAFFRSLGQQAVFISRRWHAARPGLPRLEALTGLLCASVSLQGLQHLTLSAQKALDHACAACIDKSGAVASRNPEELLEILTLLTWTASTLSDAGETPGKPHLDAIARIAPTLRALRHADGDLPRFHGGGRGVEGRLDNALAQARIRTARTEGLAMGYARLSGGRTSVIIDAAVPPTGTASVNAHASALAFELTSARRPVIVNCGSGQSFGAEWRRAGRASPSHSTLTLDGYSSARLGPRNRRTGAEPLIEGPTHMPVEISRISDGIRFQGGHNGFVTTHGLTHARTLELTFDGRAIAGEDMLTPITEADKTRFASALNAYGTRGIAFDVRFHLHPDVDVENDPARNAVALTLRSGEVWLFRHDASQDMSLETSVYLEAGRLKPRGTNQIVLSGRAMSYATRVRWSLSKTQETAVGTRDLLRDTPDMND